MIIFINIVPRNGFVDAPSLQLLSVHGKDDVVIISIKILIIIGIIVSGCLVYNNKIKIFYIIIVSMIIGGSLLNSISIYKTENFNKNNLSETKKEALLINNYLKENLKENKKDVVIISDCGQLR